MTAKAGPADIGEVVVPFSHEKSKVPFATHARSTMIASSIATLRSRGHLDRYRAHLDPVLRDALPATVAGHWLPMSDAVAHYEACDRLGLAHAELLEIGESVGDRMTKSALSLAVKLAAGSGVTPWTVLSQARRLWERAFQGSSLGVFKLGPKEARMEIIAWPLAHLEYNRVSFRGVLRSIVGPFCTRAYAYDVPSLFTATTMAHRIAWA
jgi:hypothetical protein